MYVNAHDIQILKICFVEFLPAFKTQRWPSNCAKSALLCARASTSLDQAALLLCSLTTFEVAKVTA
jgi:hypothetical protein